MASRHGSCQCGAVQFDFEEPSKWCANCHCSMCRRAHGAPFVTWLGVEAAKFHLRRGREELGRYRSSERATRSFCKVCGSPLFFESTRWPGEVHIAVAHLPDGPDRGVQGDVYLDDHPSWLSISAAIDRRDEEAGKEDPT